jgi:hypothetical protein
MNETPFETISHSKCEYIWTYTKFSPFLEENQPLLSHKYQMANSVEEQIPSLL